MDERGIVIFMADEKMSPAVGKQLLKVLNKHRLHTGALNNSCMCAVFIQKDHPHSFSPCVYSMSIHAWMIGMPAVLALI